MLIIPAIDLKDGACVRLRQGRMEDSTVFSDDPVSMAAKWVEGGCRRLHLVDLNGAFEGQPVNGEVVTAIAKRYFAEAAWGHRIELRLGPAMTTLPSIDGPLDLVFIDADKEGYVDYWEHLVPKVRPGGVLLADNVLWSGRVLDPATDSDRALVRFNQHVRADSRVDHVMLTVRDGLTLAVKK